MRSTLEENLNLKLIKKIIEGKSWIPFMNGIGNLKKKNHRWKFILHVNLHRRYYVCGFFF